ncbi:MAG: hypothetical protein PHH82_03610 [Candidatus ainarchaeum sp.]|nr:hypothetical protein [Candidatus ainarchaeum sp.]
MRKIILFLLLVVLSVSFIYAIAPCQSGDITTSVYKDYQMAYQDENFIRINNIDLLKDVNQLKDLTCLQYMDATDRTITGDIANLKNLVNLDVFSLYSNPDVYGDICSLAGATNLRSLKFAFDPKITGDISCLKDLTKLETFAMTHTNISGDISVFANMPNLKAIYVSGTFVSGDICVFSKLTNLEELGIADEYPGNPDITGDLSCLDNLKKLKRVSIYNTNTTNCEQFTKTHPDMNETVTESGMQGGGGCSKESLKTLVDYAQKYESKIGKEVQTEVKGQPNYNKSDDGPPQECIINGNFIGEDDCKALVSNEPTSKEKPSDNGPPADCFIDGEFIGKDKCETLMTGKSVPSIPEQEEAEPQEKEDRGFFQIIIDWFVSLFK